MKRPFECKIKVEVYKALPRGAFSEVKFLSNVFSFTQSSVRQSLRNVTAFMHLHDESLYQFRIVIFTIILKD